MQSKISFFGSITERFLMRRLGVNKRVKLVPFKSRFEIIKNENLRIQFTVFKGVIRDS